MVEEKKVFIFKRRAAISLPAFMVIIATLAILSVIAWYINRRAMTAPLSFPEQKIVVGATDNFPPFDLRDENGDHIGYARDISMAVAEELGVDIEYRMSPRWVEVVEWLENGEVDLIHLIAYSTERDEYFDFTIPHTLVPEVIFVRSERLDIRGLGDLEGKPIGAVRRHITHEKLLKYGGLNIVVFETPLEGLEALLDGRVDAFAYPELVFEYLVQQMGREDEIKIVGEPLGQLRYGMAVREGDQVLLSYLDRAIQRIEASGQRDEIARRWFGRKVFLGLTREEVLSLIGWAVSGVLIASLGGSAYISARYRLRKADAVLRHNLVFQHMDDSVILTSLGGEITDWNPGAERMFRYSREEILGRRLDFLFAPDGSAELFETIIRGVQGDGIWSGEIRAVRKDGSQVVCSTTVTALRNEKGDIIAYTSIIRDITERVRAEEALRRRASELAALHQTVLDITTPHELPALLQAIVERAVELLKGMGGRMYLCDPEQREARCVVSYNTPSDYTGTVLKYGEGAADTIAMTGEPLIIDDYRTWQVRAAAYDEEQPFSAVIGAPMIWQDQVIGLILVLHDTETRTFNQMDLELLTLFANHAAIAVGNARLYEDIQRQADELEVRVAERTAELKERVAEVEHLNQALTNLLEDLQDANCLTAETARRLEEVNTELESFAYSVSHDLRAPLRAMQGFAQALLEDYADRLDSIGQDYAHRIVDAASHMDTLIRDLLAYSRLTRAELRLKPVPLERVVRDALEQMEAEIQEKGAQVVVESPLPEVVGHQTTLVQVVSNLLSNAVKFVAAGVQPQVRIWAQTSQTNVRLWVEDNGLGIAPEYQERMFHVFERLHGIEAYPGTGIGLAIVRKGMQRMGGKVGVESESGQGSRFWIELPKVENEL